MVQEITVYSNQHDDGVYTYADYATACEAFDRFIATEHVYCVVHREILDGDYVEMIQAWGRSQ
jgi:hypothetical protein